MTEERYKQLKDDFLATYSAQLCEESIGMIQAAHTVEAFIAVLHAFMWTVGVKPFPDITWVRKWFSLELPLANRCGCYLDQIVAVENPPVTSIVCFGNTDLAITITKPCDLAVSLHDASRVSICAFPACMVKVRTSDADNVRVLHKSQYAKIKIKTL